MKVVDEDPNGDKLAATNSPLEEARKFVSHLERQAASRLETWLLSFDVAFAGRMSLHDPLPLLTLDSPSISSRQICAGC